jgi:hypothetical protein
MKCSVLVSEKMGGMPLVECGGAILTPDKQLIVNATLGASIIKQYGNRVVVAGVVDKTKLACGNYELVVADITKPFNVDPKRGVIADAPAVEYVARDKSMIGKRFKKKAE